MSDPSPRPSSDDPSDHLLAVYLRDHLSGAAAGLALAERCRRANEDRPLGAVLAGIAMEIADDRQALQGVMAALDVSENPVKSAVARAGEVVGRLKTNGMLTRYSPSSRVVELEGLMAGIDAKRNLWRSLRAVAATRPGLDAAALDELIARATSQRDRLRDEHGRAAREAFVPVPTP